MRRECTLLSLAVAALLLAPILQAQEADAVVEEARTISAVVGDWLVHWRSEGGVAVAYRGIPVLGANPSEFIVHQKWQKVFYRMERGNATGTLERRADCAVLSIQGRDEHFRFSKRVTLGPGSALTLEYELEVLDPEQAEIQVLYGIGKQWLDGAGYRIVAGGNERTGKLEVPDTGRIDPWGGATEQDFVTSYGKLSVRSDRALNLLCVPRGGDQWWAQGLEKGTVHRTSIEMEIEPGPDAQTGVVISDLQWPTKVRNGHGGFRVTLARDEGGPEHVSIHVEQAGGAQRRLCDPVQAAIGDEPRAVECTADLPGRGRQSLALVIADAGGEEILRLAPIVVDMDPYVELVPRLSFFSREAEGEIVARLADDLDLADLRLELAGPGAAAEAVTPAGPQVLLPLDLAQVAEGEHSVTGTLLRGDDVLARTGTTFRKLAPKPNEVKIDYASGSLITDGLPFIPFGYYTYWPLADNVMDGEVVHGFTLFSPYHGGPQDEEKLVEIGRYLDRCAEIGMRVNYHLMWTNRPEMTDEQWASLRKEIEAFRDHPALLSWYIADEPSADRAAHLTRVREVVGELDPHHPVTIVFYRGADHARLFDGAMDIVMGDPYPIPSNSVRMVSEMSDSLRAAFGARKSLWIVPQAFGGGEWWRREPTAREQRAMTYLALIHGARGIQYFIRKPPASFPKSPEMWGECSTLALETAELTPALSSPELAPPVTCDLAAAHAAAYLDRGILTVLVVNTENRPATMRLQVDGLEFSGEADVLFENRKVDVEAGSITEPIDAFGTRAYAIAVGPLPGDDVDIDPANGVVNPSFEDNPSVGIPAGNYANIPPPATCFIDSRTARHGRHSLRMNAPSDGVTPSLGLFPIAVSKDRSYRVSAWAKGKTEGVQLKLSFSGLGSETARLTTDWQQISFVVTPDEDISRAGTGVALAGKGTAWVDLIQVVPVEEPQ